MIVKSKARRTNSFKQLIEYIMSDKGRSQGKLSFLMTQNLKGNSPQEWLAQFEGNEAYRKYKHKNETKVLHEIISFHVKDTANLTTEKLERITKEYMKMRSPNGMFLAVPHVSDSHMHVHICGSPLEYLSGKSLRMTRKEFQELKAGIQQFQFNQFPELSHSIVNHGVSQSPRHTIPNTHEKIKKYLSAKLQELNPFSEEGMNALLQLGIEIYKRNDKTQGVIFNSKKYRFSKLGVVDQIHPISLRHKKELER